MCVTRALEPDSRIAGLAHGTIVGVAVIISMQTLGLDVSFVAQFVLVITAAALGGLTLAFVLGARAHVANLIGASELARYAVGDRIRLGDIEGAIVEIRRTGAEIATEEGIVSIPASQFLDSPVVRLRADAADGR